MLRGFRLFLKALGSHEGSSAGELHDVLYSKKITLPYEEETGVKQVWKNVYQWESIIVVQTGDDAGFSGGNGSGKSSLIQDIFCG